MRRTAVLVVVILVVGSVTLTAGSATSSVKLYVCANMANTAQRSVASASTVCQSGWHRLSSTWDDENATATTTTVPASTTQPVTTTSVAATTTTAPATTTTQPAAGAFLSYPHQTGPQSFSGTNVIVSNRSYVGFGSVCLTVSNATNVYLHDLDFDGCVGGIFLINVSGNIRIENVRARNTGNGTVGSGKSNVIQLNNAWQGSPSSVTTAGIRNVKALGGDTEDMISIFKSGGLDTSHPLIIEDVHEESPLSGPQAWSSSSGTCINLADAGGHDIILQDSTFLNCAAVGIQMNLPLRVNATRNIVYGAQRVTSNVGLSQFNGSSSCPCTGTSYTNNRAFWIKANGSANPIYIQNSGVTQSGNALQDTSINSANLHVTL